MNYFSTLLFLIASFFSFGQNSSDNWKVYLNAATIPLKLYVDSGRIIHVTNPETDYLTFVKTTGEPTKGKIYFFEGKGIPSGMNYPLPIEKYKLNKPTVVILKKISKNYLRNEINGLVIQLADASDRTIRPIVLIKFQVEKQDH